MGQSISGDLNRGQARDLFHGGFAIERAPRGAHTRLFDLFDPEPFTAEEAACAFRSPLIHSVEDKGLPVRRNRVVPAQLPELDGKAVTRLAWNRWQGVEQEIRVSLSHRLKHTFIIGMTGTGKSTAMLSMVLQDLEQGHGVLLIDPHGDLVDDVLARFPEHRVKDLIVLDLGDREWPVPLNLLRWKDTTERDLIIETILDNLLATYRDREMFGPIFETHYRAMMKLLMGDQPGRSFEATLLEFPRLYLCDRFRSALVRMTSEEEVKDFVEEMEDAYGDFSVKNVAPYITCKFGRLLQDPHVRRMLGHGEMVLDFDRVLAESQVVLIKLARGQLGSGVADLLTSHLVARLRLAAMARATLPREKRAPFFVYVDEFGCMAREDSFPRLLSEARKYGVGLVLAAQYATQLRDPQGQYDSLAAVLGNVGTVMAFRVGVEDARLLEAVFAPALSAVDLAESPNFEGYMRLHLDGQLARPFSFRIQLPCGPADREKAKRLVEANRARWAVPAEECDRKIERRQQAIRKLGREAA